ncbi:MAG: hypothetical protein WA510_21835, partial [Acidobacteriaceae bacterium]
MQFPRWHTAAFLVVALLSYAPPPPSWGQAVMAQPALHRRSYSEDEIDIGTRSMGRTTLPPEASGQYQLGSGGTIEVDLQPNRLSGYITRLGDRASDEGTPLTFFFATSRLSGQRLSFTTRQVHGVWFSFEGTIVRGPAQSRTQQGYY